MGDIKDNYKSNRFFCFSKGENDLIQMKRIYFKIKGFSLENLFEKDFFKMKRFSTSDEKEFYF